VGAIVFIPINDSEARQEESYGESIMRNVLSVQNLPGYDRDIGFCLWALEDTRRRTLSLLERLDEWVINWVSPVSGLSIGTLLYHIAAIELDYLYEDILGGFDIPDELERLFPQDVRDNGGKLSIIDHESLKSHLHRLSTVRKYLLATFNSMPVDEFRRLRLQAQYSVTPEWVIYHLVQHESEHRGLFGELILEAQNQEYDYLKSVGYVDNSIHQNIKDRRM